MVEVVEEGPIEPVVEEKPMVDDDAPDAMDEAVDDAHEEKPVVVEKPVVDDDAPDEKQLIDEKQWLMMMMRLR